MNKRALRRLLQWLHLDLTRNLAYDRMTRLILQECLLPSSNCIDVGAHEGEMLEDFLRFAPEGKHWAFEPLPGYYNQLKGKYGELVQVLPYALSDTAGDTTFQYVVDAPAYSGFRKRSYDGKDPRVEEILVESMTLDALIPIDVKIDFIKVDVEGAEMQVLNGARNTMEHNRPVTLFEYGMGAGDHYGTQPGQLYEFFNEYRMDIYRLKDWLKGEAPLHPGEFAADFENKREYYFLATKKESKQ